MAPRKTVAHASAAFITLECGGSRCARSCRVGSETRLDDGDGVLSHGTAARLHGLGELTNSAIALTTPRRRTSRDPDVWFKIGQLGSDDVTMLDGLPVTTVTRTICDLLAQHVDASHVATIIRQAALTDQVRLDVLAERIAPYARRYGSRPNDGEGLLERLLAQIGVTIADLVVRPAPARYQATAREALRNVVLSSALEQFGHAPERSRLSALMANLMRDSLGAEELTSPWAMAMQSMLPELDAALAKSVFTDQMLAQPKPTLSGSRGLLPAGATDPESGNGETPPAAHEQRPHPKNGDRDELRGEDDLRYGPQRASRVQSGPARRTPRRN